MSASRTRSPWAGSWPGRYTAGPRPACSTAITPSAIRPRRGCSTTWRRRKSCCLAVPRSSRCARCSPSSSGSPRSATTWPGSSATSTTGIWRSGSCYLKAGWKMQPFDADVIVVGAGPTGLMLAGELRLAGVDVVVLERLAQPMMQSRALGFSARTMEEFDQRGLLPQFGDLGVIPIGHFGGMPLDYTIVPGGNFGVRGVPQSLTEAILARWATGLGAEIRRGWELTGLTAADDEVEAEFATPAGPRRLRAAYVVGCDCGRSAV